MNITMDAILLGVFVVLNLVVGLWYARGTRTVSDYAIGDKKFPTWIITLTILATWMSGSSFAYAIKYMYKEELVGLGMYLARGAALCLMGIFISPRVGEFLRHLSLAEAMGSLYGKGIRAIVALVSIWCCICMVSQQLEMCGDFLTSLFSFQDLDSRYILVFLTLLLTLYTSLGGARSVTFTDVLQFITFFIFMPLLLLTIWRLPLASTLMEKATEDNPTPQPEVLSLYSTFCPFGAFMMQFFLPIMLSHSLAPAVFQRVQMAKDVYQVKRSFLYAAVVWFFLVLALFGMALLLKSRGIDPEKENIWAYLSNSPLTHPLFKGMAASAVLAMAMSTADSYGQAGGVNLHDLAIVLGLSTKVKKSMLRIRLGTLLLGLISLLIAWAGYGYIAVEYWKDTLYIPLVVVPMLFAIFGFRTTQKVLYISMAVGATVALLWHRWLIPQYTFLKEADETMAGLLFMPPILLLTHYLSNAPGGWVGIKDTEPLRQRAVLSNYRWRKWKKRWNSFRLHRWLAQQQPEGFEAYFLMGLYGLVTNLLASFSLTPSFLSHYSSLFYGVFLCFLLATTFLLTYAAWPPFIQSRTIALIGYPFALGFILFFTTPLLILFSKGDAPAMYFLYLINMVMGLLLLHWPFVLTMGTVGLLMAVTLYQIGIGGPLPQLLCSIDLFTCSLVALPFIASIVALIANQRKYGKTVQYANELKNNMHHYVERYGWLHRQISQRYDDYRATCKDGVEQFEKVATALEKTPSVQGVEEMRKIVHSRKAYTEKCMENMVAQLSLRYDKMPLDEFIDYFEAHYNQLPKLPPLVCQGRTKKIEVVWDRNRLSDILVALIKELLTDTDRLIHLRAYSTALYYPSGQRTVEAIAVVIQQGISDQRITKINEMYTYEEHPKTLAEDEISRTIDAHYGLLKRGQYATYLVLPQSLKKIRSTYTHDGHALSTQPPSPNALRKAQKVETAFWQKVLVQLPEKEDETFEGVKKALDFTKHYHGPTLRKSNSLYYTHPIKVAMKTMLYTSKPTVWIAALLHDVLEDSHCSPEEIAIIFGAEVKETVKMVSTMRFSHKKYKLAKKKEQAERLLNCTNKDAQLIKLCDRWHNLETLGAMSPTKQQEKIAETLEYFVPLAEKLGYTEIVTQLKYFCQQYG